MNTRTMIPPSCAVAVLLSAIPVWAEAQWQPAAGTLMTRWGKEVDPENVHREYPRPQMVREDWMNLNGLWQYAIGPRDALKPGMEGRILVPFPLESALSGVGKTAGRENKLWYRRTFSLPDNWDGKRVLLNFGAVDWETVVWINRKEVGRHTGGYDAFSFDITEALKEKTREQEIVVSVWDPTDEGTQPRGKQVRKPHGIWYTPVTGIWQTVWLEAVAPTYIKSLTITPDIDSGEVIVTGNVAGAESNLQVRVQVRDNGRTIGEASGPQNQPIRLQLPNAEHWSPGNPHLYDLQVTCGQDSVSSYFGMRKISLGRDRNGITRIFLNNKPFFMYGPLDQGWWPDGLYAAPSDEALRYDLEATRKLGFNLVRKHVKVEPLRWYYHCDRMGLLVWQDMPNGGGSPRWPLDGVEIERSAGESAQFDREWTAIIRSLYNHPSIVAWIPFNEAWGQFRTEHWTRRTRKLDPARLIISASGGNDFGNGDIHDIHQYPGPKAPPAESSRAAVLGEYGGLGLPLKGHTWQQEKNWGYRSYGNRQDLQAAYLKLLDPLGDMIRSHLSAAIYTQTTDVEVEVNGLMTYDREVLKFEVEKLAGAHARLYSPVQPLSAAERSRAHTIAYWRFEDGKPGELVSHDRMEREGVAVTDASGQRNHLYAYAKGNAPRRGADVASPLIPCLELPNRGSLDDSAEITGPTRDLYTNSGRSRTHMNMINTFPFTEWTVEASVKPVELDRVQTIVGEDGKPTAGPDAPLQLKLRRDNHLAMVAIDSTGKTRSVATLKPVRAGTWQHVAAMSDGRNLRLYLLKDGNYQLQEEVPFTGKLINHPGTWTVGRGFHNGKLANDARAHIDEVRVSSMALPRELLLWSGVSRVEN
ncbi:MAG: glycoside hydrolase family 2 TIM barrel-domain containing protein [Roseibacillus sp.]|nr:hypothetical protein [Roseibacillus sp.]MDP7307684.1 glycoside hydrolase family 2 TIM barrel-domain containing protein [Roseibacillus sp.]HJM65837.1 LamG-like jellyroll fold domain-containing protein [Roseibacillus sp.]